MRVNTKPASVKTYEGAAASRINSEEELKRAVMACLLWEDQFYESGESIADRIKALVPKVPAAIVAQIAVDARTKMKLRHVPLLLVREMARIPTHKHLVGNTLAQVIQRADELTEFLAIYWMEKRQPLSAQVKKGLAKAFAQFNEYELAKYNRDNGVKLRDVLFLCHAKPADAPDRKYTRLERKREQELKAVPKLTVGESLYRRLVDGELQTPDTWEVALSGGADKKETFERLMAEGKLGALAFLRNLRNMQEAGISKATVKSYTEQMKTDRVLPFRFLAAARVVPAWEDVIEPVMLHCLDGQEKIPGKTIVMVDVSGSMNSAISAKSEMLRVDAAYGLAILLREICEEVDIASFSDYIKEIPPRHGFALRDAIHTSQVHNGTALGAAVKAVTDSKDNIYDRMIVITDEQSADKVPAPTGKGYMINVAAYQNGVGYGQWMHINGWSESVIDYIRAFEATELASQRDR